MTIRELEPKALWNNFYALTQQPRPSKHEEKVRAMLVQFAKEHNLECRVDEVGNIIMKKAATPGMENRRGVILQAHVDMVPQKNNDKVHDFLNDPIETRIIDGWVWANGTTLGADNGIGAAAAMTVLAADDIQHGPIEALFTIDEETGMTGAFGLKPGLFEGDLLLNMDSETEGELYVGCAGGVDATMHIGYNMEACPKDYVACRLTIGGLKGGHSGMDINLGRGNANKLLFRHLRWVAECGIRLVEVDGGSLRNAIPREASATFVMPREHKECILAEFDKVSGWVSKELSSVEPDYCMKYEEVALPEQVMTDADTQKLINVMMCVPNGVVRMSSEVAGLVETSLNVARVQTENGTFTLMALLRSSVDTSKEALAERLVCLAELAGGKCDLTGAYPGWKPNMASPLLKAMQETYSKLFGTEPKVMAIHAGLECGLLGGIYPNWDMISFGPTIMSPHSPAERVNIESVQKFWQYLLETLKAVPTK
ncbi:MAG: aminoacyl-histidine dipeptidase [Bacteroidales bacterium]|nr:aminoacyl-histidine dipeptidase [Bacteroidales bacterium]